VKSLYNREDEIEKTGEVFAMRGMVKFGFPLVLDNDQGESVRYRNLLDRKDEQMKYIGKVQSDMLEYIENETKDDDEFYSTIIS